MAYDDNDEEPSKEGDMTPEHYTLLDSESRCDELKGTRRNNLKGNGQAKTEKLALKMQELLAAIKGNEVDEATAAQDEPQQQLGQRSFNGINRNVPLVLSPVPRFQPFLEPAISKDNVLWYPLPVQSLDYSFPACPHAQESRKAIEAQGTPEQPQELGQGFFCRGRALEDKEMEKTTKAAWLLLSLKNKPLNETAKNLGAMKCKCLSPLDVHSNARTKRKAVQIQEEEEGLFYGNYAPPDMPPAQSLQSLIKLCSKPFEKQLTSSDVSDNLSRLCMIKEDVKTRIFPLLRKGDNPYNGIDVITYNMDGKEYPMQFKAGASEHYVLKKGWRSFYHDHRLVEKQDFVTVWAFRNVANNLCFAINSRRLSGFKTIKANVKAARNLEAMICKCLPQAEQIDELKTPLAKRAFDYTVARGRREPRVLQERGLFYGNYAPPDIPPAPSLRCLIQVCSKPFEKQLTSSDVSDNLARLCMVKEDVENHIFPLLRKGDDPSQGMDFITYTMNGKEYPMQFKTWGSRIYVLKRGWRSFNQDHRLVEMQDFVTMWAFRNLANILCFAITSRRLPVFKTIKTKRLRQY